MPSPIDQLDPKQPAGSLDHASDLSADGPSEDDLREPDGAAQDDDDMVRCRICGADVDCHATLCPTCGDIPRYGMVTKVAAVMVLVMLAVGLTAALLDEIAGLVARRW